MKLKSHCSRLIPKALFSNIIADGWIRLSGCAAATHSVKIIQVELDTNRDKVS